MRNCRASGKAGIRYQPVSFLTRQISVRHTAPSILGHDVRKEMEYYYTLIYLEPKSHIAQTNLKLATLLRPYLESGISTCAGMMGVCHHN